jgi:CheY-like chemotaxis protein
MDRPETVILLVEDDAGHALLIERNLRRAGIANRIVKLGGGQQTLDYLFPSGEPAERPRVVVLLDLNMPGISGYQVLQRLKTDERTRSIPVVVLTTTDDSAEIKRCYDLGCNAYVTKPIDYEQFSEAIHRLGLMLTVVRMPEGHVGAAEPKVT